jgi:HD-GYP domain-containing protein (c-di-GMP phosphodiesterase class II)
VKADDTRALLLGRDLIVRLAALLKVTCLYDADNAALRSVSCDLRASVEALVDEGGECEIAIHEDALFVGGRRIRESLVASSSYQRVVDLLRAAHVGVLSIEPDADPRHLEAFARLVLEVGRGVREPGELPVELGVRGLTGIAISAARDRQGPVRLNADQVAKRVYLRSISVVKTVFHEQRSRDRVSARRVKRVVQEMIESLDANPGYLLNLASLKNYDEYTFNHSVNVSVMAIALGRHVGLSRRQLYAIGQAGMLHDLGKLCIPKEILNKPGRLSPEEREIVNAHPVDGFISIATQLGVSSDSIPVALASYEHHVNEDGSGYPAAASARPKGLLSRIVSIVDRYDAMTSARVYRGHSIPPPRTLAIMYHRQRGHHDRLLLRYFMNLVGHYPLGTLVLLTDGSLGVVVEGAADPLLRRLPVVRVVTDQDGRRIPPVTVDLAAKAKESEPLGIAQVVDAAENGIDVMEYLI